MLITKKHIPRRTFLRGAGVAVALPLLEAMLPAQTPLAQTAANQKTRFVGLFSPHGWAAGDYWVPKTTGSGFEFPMILEPLEPYRDHVNLFSNLDSTSSMPPPGTSGGDHSRTSASLTGYNPKKTAGADIYGGTSVDQHIAQRFGQDTLLPSIQLGIENPGSNTGICGWGYSCAYSNSISWAAPNRPLPHEINPQVVFERLFGDGGTPEERQARREQKSSILDSVTRKVSALKRDLAPSDRVRIDDYLEDVREIERRLQIAASASTAAPDMDVPFGVPPSFTEHIGLMYDMQALAFQGDVTRVSALMYARDVSLRNYPECGVTTVNHSASHHGEDAKRKEEWAIINRYHIQMLANFLGKLQSIPEGNGNLLDNTVVLFTSNMGNGNQHSHVNVGHLLIGGHSLGLEGGRHIDAGGSPTSNLLLSTLELFGIEEESIGDSTGSVTL